MGRSRFPKAALLALLVLPPGAVADSVTLTLVPTGNPDNAVGCVLLRSGGFLRAVEVMGPGLPAPRPMQWVISRGEGRRLDAALGALASGQVPWTEPEAAAAPRPPFVLLAWSRDGPGQARRGLVMQPGLALPPPLAGLVIALMPGSRCARLLRDAPPPPGR